MHGEALGTETYSSEEGKNTLPWFCFFSIKVQKSEINFQFQRFPNGDGLWHRATRIDKENNSVWQLLVIHECAHVSNALV